MGTLLRLKMVLGEIRVDCPCACDELWDRRGKKGFPKSKDILFDRPGRSSLRPITTEAGAKSPRNAKIGFAGVFWDST